MGCFVGRFARVWGTGMSRPVIEFDPGPHTYIVNGDPGFPSVTEIIKATVAKPFGIAAWYGYKMGVGAAYATVGQWIDHSSDDAYDIAKGHENPNSVLTKAGARGTAIHDALEAYAKTSKVPSPMDFDEEDHKRVAGVCDWLDKNRPEFFGSEVRTASLEHRYVGTLDGFVRFEDGEYKGKTARIDFKTSKRVYPDEHFVQLEAYEGAEIECGEEPSDVRLVVHLPQSGKWKNALSDRELDDFVVLLRVFERQRKYRG